MFKDYLASSKQHIEQWLGEVLSSPNQEFKPLYESMNYSLMQGGKRIRPILSKAVLEMLHKDPADYKEFLCAMECIHTYSLVHDDLPAMDNDDYRRGNLTNHKVYISDLLQCIDSNGREHELLSRRLSYNSDSLGEIYTKINDINMCLCI